MLYRTFGFSSTAAAGNFTAVTAGSYYAEALAHAKALGIATAEADGHRQVQAVHLPQVPADDGSDRL